MTETGQTVKQIDFLKEPTVLAQGVYMQMVVKLKFLDDAIIRSNDAEEVLTFSYGAPLNNRFIIPWRKIKGKFRRIVMEKQRGMNIQPDCSLKDNLCMECPSCFIFGGTGETSTAKVPYNILSRVMGETFISMNPVGEIEPYTQNAVDEKTLSTGQALMSILKVPAGTEFIGVLTLKDPTKEMASIVVNNLPRLTRIGARSVEWGRIETTILGYKLSDREDLSAYNLASKTNDGIKNGLQDVSSLTLPKLDEAYQSLTPKIKTLLTNLIPPKTKDKKPKKGKEQAVLVEAKAETEEEAGENT
jgi:CRISPR type I-D-associated protein Csc2